LEGPVRDALLDGDEPIGAILLDAAIETRRELLPYTVDSATADDADDSASSAARRSSSAATAS
jgi:chorismate-pyruvate lyase